MKLYLVTRRDLAPGHRAVQSAHALREFTEQFPDEDASWYRESNTIAMLEVRNGEELHALCDRAREVGVPVAEWGEPYYGRWNTALAIGPAGADLVSHLPLAFRKAV